MQLQGTENSVYLDLLRLFAHGTWSDYKSKHAFFPGFFHESECCYVDDMSWSDNCSSFFWSATQKKKTVLYIKKNVQEHEG